MLTAYGSCYELAKVFPDSDEFVNWTEKNFQYVQYNPRKNIKRYGLSITSLDGGLTGIPDLDSLTEYNKLNGTLYNNSDFRKFTPVYNYDKLKEILDPIKKDIGRTHVIKLDSGGYFPPHRDISGTKFDCFRLFIPLKNTNNSNFIFVIDDKLQHFSKGSVYFLDSAKIHSLINYGNSPCYMVVVNVDVTEESVSFVTRNLKST